MATYLMVRLDEATGKSPDQLAKMTAPTRSFLARHALRRYVEEESWQVTGIHKAVKDADAGEFAPNEEIRHARQMGRACVLNGCARTTTLPNSKRNKLAAQG